MYTTQQEPWKEFFSPRPEDIVYEDAHVIAFRDKTPQAASAQSGKNKRCGTTLEGACSFAESYDSSRPPYFEYYQFVFQWTNLCHYLTGTIGLLPHQYRMGFHVKPFRSIPYLHMHCLLLPFRNTWQRIRFSEASGGFISAFRLLGRIQAR